MRGRRDRTADRQLGSPTVRALAATLLVGLLLWPNLQESGADAANQPGTSPIPVGLIVPYAGQTSTLPTGWRIADGSALNRTAFPDLYGAIGTTYGPGDGSTTFNLPDLQARIPIGRATSGRASALGEIGGRLDHGGQTIPLSTRKFTFDVPAYDLWVPAFPAHQHRWAAGGASRASACCGPGWVYDVGILAPTGGGGGVNVRPPAQSPTSIDATPAAVVGSANPPYRTLTYLVAVSADAALPCGSLAASATPSVPLAAEPADGSVASAALAACQNAAFGSSRPDLRGRFALGKAASGTASALNAAGGQLGHTHTVTSYAGQTYNASYTETVSLAEADHGHSLSIGSFSVPDGRYGPAVTGFNSAGMTWSSTGILGGPQTRTSTWSQTVTAVSATDTRQTTAAEAPFLALDYVVRPLAATGASAGAVLPYAGANAPGGWLLADGRAVSRAAYPALFAEIGTTYGPGDGSTTFNLPNLSGRMVLGRAQSGTGSALGSSGGSLDHTHSVTVPGDQPVLTLPSHKHAWTFSDHRHNLNAGNANGWTDYQSSGSEFSTASGYGTPYASDPAGGGTYSSAFSSVLQQPARAAAPAQTLSLGPENAPYLTVSYLIATGSSTAGAVADPLPSSLSALPLGLVVPFAGPTASLPAGWRIANGAAVSRTSFAELFGVVGTSYGTGDGSTTFNLPDLRGRFPIGRATAGRASVLGEAGGKLDHGAQSLTLPQRSFTFDVPASSLWVPPFAAHQHRWAGAGAARGEQCCGPGWVYAIGTLTGASSGGGVTLQVPGQTVTSGVGQPVASVAAANPPYRALTYLVSVSKDAVLPCGSLWGNAAMSAPPSTEPTDGGAAGSSLTACQSPTFGATRPDLRGRIVLGRPDAGTASTLGATGGQLNHTHTVTSYSGQSYPASGYSETLTIAERDHGHSMSIGSFSVPDGRYGPTNAGFNSAGMGSGSTGMLGGPQTRSSAWSQTLSAVSDTDTRETASANPPFLALDLVTTGYSLRGLEAGAVLPFAGSAAPDGWLVANGLAVSRSLYPALFAEIGTSFGAGNGSTTFNLPNLTGRMLLGRAQSGTGSTVGSSGGSLDHTHAVTIPGDQPKLVVPAHKHAWTFPDHQHNFNAGNTSPSTDYKSWGAEFSTSSGYGTPYASEPAGGGTYSSDFTLLVQQPARAAAAAFTTTLAADNPPYLALTYLIATGSRPEPPRAETLHANGAQLVWSRYLAPAGRSFSRYEVHRSATAGFSPTASTLLATIRDPATTTYTDTAAAAGKAFSYLVSVNGIASPEIRVTLPTDLQAEKTLQPPPADSRTTTISSLTIDGARCMNYGAGRDLVVGNDAASTNRALLQFDVRDIPSDATIASAVVTLWRRNATAVATQVDLHRATADWDEGSGAQSCSGDGASWTDGLAGVRWAAAGGDFEAAPAASAQIAAGAPAATATWDVTSLVRRWIAGESPNLGLLAKLADEGAAAPRVLFASDDEDLDRTQRPKLLVTYVDGSHASGPQVDLSAPGAGTKVSQTTKLVAAAGDDRRVDKVEFLLDGNVLATDTTEPFEVNWDSRTAANGSHSLAARATDDAGNVSTTAAAGVSVGNSAPPTTSVSSLVPGYDAIVRADRPLGYWRLGETSGTVARDQAGGAPAILSGRELGDDTRAARVEGDGRTPPDSSLGIWEPTTNLLPNGGVETTSNGHTTYNGAGGLGSATLVRDNTVAKFGSWSLKLTTGGLAAGEGHNLTGTGRAVVGAGVQLAGSVWIYSAAGGESIVAYEEELTATTYLRSQTLQAKVLAPGWQRLSGVVTTGAGTELAQVVVRATGTAALTVWLDGFQLEQQPLPTPYVNTDGVVATRQGARVQLSASALADGQSWIAGRVRLGFGSTAATGQSWPRLFAWGSQSAPRTSLDVFYEESSRTWALQGYADDLPIGTARSAAHTFQAGDFATVVAAWTPTQLRVSVNGAPFQSAARSTLNESPSDWFDIGSHGAANYYLDSDLLWFATGTGALTDADAAALSARGNADPALADLPGQPTSVLTGAPSSDGAYAGSPALGTAGLVAGSDAAATFDGSDDTVSIPGASIPAPLTAEAWVRPDVLPDAAGSSTVVLGRVSTFAIRLVAQQQGQPRFGATVQTPGGPVELLGTIPVRAGRSHHVALALTPTSAALYVNGALEAQQAFAGPPAAPAGDLVLAGDPAGSPGAFRFKGALDEVAVYPAALDAAAVKQHFDGGRAYFDAVAADDPLAWWRLNETSGTTAADASGHGKSGTLAGGLGLGAPGALMRSPEPGGVLDGVDDSLALGDDFDFAGIQPFTFETWLNPSRIDTSYRRLFSKETSTAPRQGILVYLVRPPGWNRTVLGFERWRDNVGQGVNTDGVVAPQPGRWYHVVASFDGTAMCIYIDGEKARCSTYATPVQLPDTTYPARVGAYSTGGSPIAGSLDEVAIYDRALTPAQVQAHYVAGVATGRSGRVKVTAAAADDTKVTHVEFYVDGTRFADDTVAPFAAGLPTLGTSLPAADGRHAITTRAYDEHDQQVTSAPSPLLIGNGTGSKYRGTLALAATPPLLGSYDPAAAVQEKLGFTVGITNRTTTAWATGAVQLRSTWTSVDDPTLTAPGPIVDVPGLGAGVYTTVKPLVDPPALPEGVRRASYRLRFDLYDVATAASFSASGNPPLDAEVVVQKTLPTGLGLERYYQYAGEELGAGAQSLVNLATGNLIARWTPFSLPGRGLATVADLTYNGLEGATASPVGNGFSLALSSLTRLGSPLDVHPNASDTAAGRTAKYAELIDGDGTTHRFTSTDGITYREPAGVHLYLRKYSTTDSSRMWALTRPDRLTFFYDSDGQPTYVEDLNGNRITFDLEGSPSGKRVWRVRDAAGRAVTLTYYSALTTAAPAVIGRLKLITDHLGNAFELAYYDDGNLLRWTQRGGINADGSYLQARTLVFAYTSNTADAPAIADPSARANPSPATDQSTRLYSVRDPRGAETTFGYSSDGKLVRRTNRAGETTAYAYDTATRTTTLAAPLSRTTRYTFDAEGKPLTVVNPLGQTLSLTWSADRHVTRTVQPTGAETRYAYNDNGYLTDVWDELDDHTQLAYADSPVDAGDAAANWTAGRSIPHVSRLATKVEPNGTATPAPDDYRWSFGYDAKGNPTSATDPTGAISRTTYNADGTVATSTDPLGNVTTVVSYDANGLPTKVRDALLKDTTFGYDANGNVLWAQDALHQASTGGDPTTYRSVFVYDTFGRLGRQSTPKSTGFAPGVLLWSDAEYDANDNVVATIAPYYGFDGTKSGARTTTQYDAMDRPVLTTEPDTSADPLGERTRLVYDGAGRLAQAVSPKGVQTSTIADDQSTLYGYDALDRIVREARPDYDSAGTLVRTPTTHYCYGGAGDLVRVTAPRANLATVDCAAAAPAYTTRYAFDAAHRLVRQTDPAGNEQSATYDANGNVVTTTNEAGTVSTRTYDQRGALVRVVEPFEAGRSLTTAYEYDAGGNLRRLITPRAWDASPDKATFADYVTSYEYDKLNRLVRTLLPTAAGTTAAYTHSAYDAVGNLLWTSVPVAAATPNGVDALDTSVLEYWDTGWIRTSKDPGTTRMHFDYTAEGQQSTRTPETADGSLDRDRQMLWSYDPDGQLRETRDLGGQGSSYAYDANDALLRASESSGLTSAGQAPIQVELAYDGLGNLARVAQQKTGAVNKLISTYGYDPSGNLTDQVENAEETAAGAPVAPGRRHTFAYDLRDLVTTEIDFGADPATAADDERVVHSYGVVGRPTGRELSRWTTGAWAVEQDVTTSYALNGKAKRLTTKNGAGSVLEQHDLSYETLDGVYVDGQRTRDTFTLAGPDATAPCRTSACTEGYEYDAMLRLTKESDGHGTDTAYSLDPAGNVLVEARTKDGVTTTRTATFVGQQLRTRTEAGTTSRFFYTGEGALACVTSSTGASVADCLVSNGAAPSPSLLSAYSYDYRGRLASFRSFANGVEGATTTYRYDALDRPAEETEKAAASSPTTTVFEYLGLSGQVGKEESRSSTGSLLGTKSYSFDAFGRRLGVTATPSAGAPTRYSFGYDAHGSVSLLLRQGGAVQAAYGYQAYGAGDAELSKGDNSTDPVGDYRYTGKRFDPLSETLDMGARRFAPSLGRFLQFDSYAGSGANLGLTTSPLTGNRYALAGGNPVGYVEADGHRPVCDDESVWARPVRGAEFFRWECPGPEGPGSPPTATPEPPPAPSDPGSGVDTAPAETFEQGDEWSPANGSSDLLYFNASPSNGLGAEKERYGNGCGPGGWKARAVPDQLGPFGHDFRDACENHDRCYGTWGSWRKTCDSGLLHDIRDECADLSWNPFQVSRIPLCFSAADIYYHFVRQFGKGSFRGGQRSQLEEHCPFRNRRGAALVRVCTWDIDRRNG